VLQAVIRCVNDGVTGFLGNIPLDDFEFLSAGVEIRCDDCIHRMLQFNPWLGGLELDTSFEDDAVILILTREQS
jgi:hypothetical protein